MAVYNVSIPFGGISQAYSAYGSSFWAVTSTQLQSNIPNNGGTYWVIWNLGAIIGPSTPGESLNGIHITTSHDFTVGGGGVGMTRVASLGTRIERTSAAFGGAAHEDVLGGVVGSGVGANVVADINKAGYTSTDLANGTLLLGFCVSTNNANVASGYGLYRLGNIAVTVYTGPDVPYPPAGSPGGILTSAAANSNPGRLPEQQFTNVRADWTGSAQSFISYWFDILGPAGGGITFAANGTTQLRIYGPAYPNTGWNFAETGAMNIARATRPGSYALRCDIQHNLGTYRLTTPLVIPAQLGGHTEA